MTVHLPPELEQFIAARIASGHYTTASEVVRDALHLLADHNHLNEARRAALRRKVDEAAADEERGDFLDGEEFFRQLEQEEAQLEAHQTRR